MNSLLRSFLRWLKHAPAGAEFPYHNGLLAKDRERNEVIDEIGRAALAAHTHGYVMLLQRRLPHTSFVKGHPMSGGCLYLAQRTRKGV